MIFIVLIMTMMILLTMIMVKSWWDELVIITVGDQASKDPDYRSRPTAVNNEDDGGLTNWYGIWTKTLSLNVQSFTFICASWRIFDLWRSTNFYHADTAWVSPLTWWGAYLCTVNLFFHFELKLFDHHHHPNGPCQQIWSNGKF